VPTDTPPSSDLGASLDRYLDSLLSAELFHGAVLVARNGEIILAKGYGSSNYDDFTPNTAHTRFRLASVTKQFTALAIMQLAAEGKLRIEDSICGYIDQCPQHWQSITLRHLLQHTSGIPNYTDFLDYELTQMDPATPLQLVDRFRDQNLLFTPGEGYSYGNSGYVLLGVVIERVSGQSYREYLRQHIFEPLGMVDTGVAYDPEPGSPIAKGYQYYATNTRPIDTSTLFSAGAMYASVQDLYLWDQALYTEKLLPKPFLDQIFAPGRSQYGFGWKITEQRGHIRASHSGEMDGCRTALLRYPNDQITVIVLSNMLYADVDAIAAYIGQIVLNS
jgi:CubicO group peptidase (beta-lactamase class C family)